MSMDVSSDDAFLVTGSADKNVKIWGLDFGDCHRSLFAHADSVMAVRFLHGTHLFFTAGKDGLIKARRLMHLPPPHCCVSQTLTNRALLLLFGTALGRRSLRAHP